MSGNETNTIWGPGAYEHYQYKRSVNLEMSLTRREMKRKNLFRTIEEDQASPEWTEPFQRRDLTEIFPV